MEFKSNEQFQVFNANKFICIPIFIRFLIIPNFPFINHQHSKHSNYEEIEQTRWNDRSSFQGIVL